MTRKENGFIYSEISLVASTPAIKLTKYAILFSWGLVKNFLLFLPLKQICKMPSEGVLCVSCVIAASHRSVTTFGPLAQVVDR